MNKFKLYSLTALASAGLICAGCATNAGADRAQDSSAPNSPAGKGFLAKLFESTKPVTLPPGTVLPVTIDTPLSSETSRPGEQFDATVYSPVMVDGKTVIPSGAQATGRVVEAKPSGRLSSPGQLEITLTSITVDGRSYDIEAGDASRSGRSHTKHNLTFIGGGAAAGTLIGAIAGGGKGALIGSLVGAGGGTAAAAATGKMAVQIPAETRLSFALLQPLTVKVRS